LQRLFLAGGGKVWFFPELQNTGKTTEFDVLFPSVLATTSDGAINFN